METSGNMVTAELTLVADPNDNGKVYTCKAKNKAISTAYSESITFTVYCKSTLFVVFSLTCLFLLLSPCRYFV